MLGGGGGSAFGPAPFLLGGGRGNKKSAPQFPGPQGEPAHGLHPRFVVAEIWADGVGMRGGGGGFSTPLNPQMGGLGSRLEPGCTRSRFDFHPSFALPPIPKTAGAM